MPRIKQDENKVFEELKTEILKQSGKEHINRGQDDAIREFSKIWVKFEDKLYIMPEDFRTHVEEAIRSWIGFQIEKRRKG